MMLKSMLPIVLLGVFLPIHALGTFCPGLNVGTSANTNNIVRDGVTVRPFTAESPSQPFNTLGSEFESSTFYFNGPQGTPIKATVAIDHTTSFQSFLINPTLSGSILGKERGSKSMIDGSNKDLTVRYNCFDAGGTSILWMTISLDQQEAQRVCGSQEYGPVDIYVVWSKYCPSQLRASTAVIVGTEPGLSDLVLNGKTQRAWEMSPEGRDDSFGKVVLSNVLTSTFYIGTRDNSRQVYGRPRFQTEEDKVIVTLTSSPDGGVASSVPQEINVEYLCDREAAAATEVTMVIDLCSETVPMQNCGPEANFGYEPIELKWVKNCGLMDSSFWFSDVLVMLTLAGSILCVFGCCFNYSVKHRRGIDVVPGGKILEQCLNKVSASGADSRRRRGGGGGTSSAYRKQMNIRQEDCGIAIGETQSPSGVVTVHFDSAPAAGGVLAYQSTAKEEGEDDYDETDF